MTGAVLVEGATPTATATATATQTATPTATQPPAASQTATPTATATQAATFTPTVTATPAPSVAPAARPSPAPAGPAASAPQVARNQRGSGVRGSIVVARAGSRVQVDVLAKASALGGRGSKPVSVGRFTKSAPAGKLSFSIPLNAKAKKALRKGKLALTIKITVTPSSGDAFSATRTVSLKGR
jgi:hypothetical protein